MEFGIFSPIGALPPSGTTKPLALTIGELDVANPLATRSAFPSTTVAGAPLPAEKLLAPSRAPECSSPSVGGPRRRTFTSGRPITNRPPLVKHPARRFAGGGGDEFAPMDHLSKRAPSSFGTAAAHRRAISWAGSRSHRRSRDPSPCGARVDQQHPRMWMDEPYELRRANILQDLAKRNGWHPEGRIHESTHPPIWVRVPRARQGPFVEADERRDGARAALPFPTFGTPGPESPREW